MKAKYILITANRSQKKYEATYLGNEINRDVNIKREVLNKMQEVRKNVFKNRAVLESIKCESEVATYHF